MEKRRLPLRTIPRLHRALSDVLFENVAGRDLVQLKLLGKELLVLNNPELIEHAVELEPEKLERVPFAAEARFAGDTIPLTSGDRHARRRRLIEPLFDETAIAPYAEPIVTELERCASSWRDGAVLDIEAEMERCTADAVAAVLFDGDLAEMHDDIADYHRLSRKAVARTINPLAPLLWRVPLPLTRQFTRAQSRFNAAVDPLVVARRADADRRDLLTELVRAAGSDGDRLSNGQARDEAWTYYSQGAPESR